MDISAIYQKDLLKVKILTHEESCQQYQLMKAGNNDARNLLIESCLRLSKQIINKFAKHWNASHDMTDDMMQDASLAIMRGVDNWNPELAKLTTFVGKCIYNCMFRWKMKNYHKGIYIPISTLIPLGEVLKHGMYNEKYDDSQRERLLAAIPAVTMTYLSHVEKAVQTQYLNKIHYDCNYDGNDENESSYSIDHKIKNFREGDNSLNQQISQLRLIVSSLDKEEIKLLQYYYVDGLIGREIAEKYGITRQAIDLKLRKIKKKIKTSFTLDKLAKLRKLKKNAQLSPKSLSKI